MSEKSVGEMIGEVKADLYRLNDGRGLISKPIEALDAIAARVAELEAEAAAMRGALEVFDSISKYGPDQAVPWCTRQEMQNVVRPAVEGSAGRAALAVLVAAREMAKALRKDRSDEPMSQRELRDADDALLKAVDAWEGGK